MRKSWTDTEKRERMLQSTKIVYAVFVCDMKDSRTESDQLPVSCCGDT